MPDLAGVLAALVVCYVGASWYLWANQRKLVFLPTRKLARTPVDVHLRYEDVQLPVETCDDLSRRPVGKRK